jgi:membrane fusion protein (multidrug efflux system)
MYIPNINGCVLLAAGEKMEAKTFYSIGVESKLKLLSSRVCIGLLVAVGISACSGGGDQPPTPAPLEVQVAAVQKRDLPLSREFIGRTVGAIDADIRARVEGVLTSIAFDEGREVKEGQLLYTIDPAPFEAKLAEARAQLAEAVTRHTQTVADYNRIKPLADIDAVSKRELDMAIAHKGVAEGAIDAAKAQVKSAEIQLSYTKITSPTSGFIGISKAKVGEFVGRAPGTTLLNTVSRIDPIHVQFSLTEREYLYFARLMQAQGGNEKRVLEVVLSDGTVHPQKGELVKVDSQVNPQTGTLMAEAAFANPTLLLRPGLFAKIKTVAEVRTGALLVPKRAIKSVQGKAQIFVVADSGLVDQRTIEVGPEFEGLQVVESGLSGSEVVAIDAIQRLRSGVTVKPTLVAVTK